jgi:hypothetical protein
VDPAKPASPAPHFLVFLIGGPLLFLASLWLVDATGHWFFVMSLAGLGAFFVGLVRAIAALARTAVHRPFHLVVALAASGVVCWGVVANWPAISLALEGRSLFAGRFVDAKHAFSIEFPAGWQRSSREGFAVHGNAPEMGPEGCRAEFGVLFFHLTDTGSTLPAFVERMRGVIQKIPGVTEQPAVPLTVAGREATEIAYTNDKDSWLATFVVDEKRGYSLLGITCPAGASRDQETYRAIAQTFRAGTSSGSVSSEASPR